jgi:hypothetical protein
MNAAFCRRHHNNNLSLYVGENAVFLRWKEQNGHFSGVWDITTYNQYHTVSESREIDAKRGLRQMSDMSDACSHRASEWATRTLLLQAKVLQPYIRRSTAAAGTPRTFLAAPHRTAYYYALHHHL